MNDNTENLVRKRALASKMGVSTRTIDVWVAKRLT
jgi:predicted DNA-binding transcriptional regulator AlpA